MSLADNRSRRQRRGRPRNEEREYTVVSGDQLRSWGIPGRTVKGKFPWEYISEDDLVKSNRGYKIYREMRNDDQIKACLWLFTTLVTQRAFDVVPAGESEQDQKVAQFVKKNLDKINIRRILNQGLKCALDFGFCAGELVWDFSDDASEMYLKEVKFRDPEHMIIEVDIHGNIVQFRQEPELHPLTEIRIPKEKMFHYAYQSEFGNPYGKSAMRGVYRAWWSKKYITQFYNVFLERFGQPLMMMKYPQGASEALKAALRNIMTNLSSKTDILVPEGVVVELVEATRAGTARYDEALWYYDTAIAKGLLVPALLGMGGSDVKRGSDSQSRLHLRTLLKYVQSIGEDLFDSLSHQVITQLVDANFTVEPPKLIWQDYGEFESFEITDAIKELFNAGILDVDQEDINYARGLLGLPLRDEGNEDEVSRPNPAMMTPGGGLAGGGVPSGGQGAGAQQGNNQARKGASTSKTERRTGQRRE